MYQKKFTVNSEQFTEKSKKLWTMDCGPWTKKGFTLVEIMIVVGIIGLILTMAIPNFINARTKARAKACVQNLHQIHGAKQQWALDTNALDTAVPTSANLAPTYLEKWRSCPAAGVYTIGAVNVLPTCGKGTNATTYTWDDHVY